MNETNVKLNNVRLSFPSLWKARKGPDATSKEAFQATFILHKRNNAADIKAVNAMIDLIVKEAFKGKRPPKVCLRDGTEKGDTDGYGDEIVFISARSDKRPHVVDGNLASLVEEDGKLYAGCYVNATVRLWAQDNQYGKRVNASLRAVQFVKKGDAFGEGSIDVSKEFEVLAEDDVI